MQPDNIPPEIALPVAAALWAIASIPFLAAKARAARAARRG